MARTCGLPCRASVKLSHYYYAAVQLIIVRYDCSKHLLITQMCAVHGVLQEISRRNSGTCLTVSYYTDLRVPAYITSRHPQLNSVTSRLTLAKLNRQNYVEAH